MDTNTSLICYLTHGTQYCTKYSFEILDLDISQMWYLRYSSETLLNVNCIRKKSQSGWLSYNDDLSLSRILLTRRPQPIEAWTRSDEKEERKWLSIKFSMSVRWPPNRHFCAQTISKRRETSRVQINIFEWVFYCLITCWWTQFGPRNKV